MRRKRSSSGARSLHAFGWGHDMRLEAAIERAMEGRRRPANLRAMACYAHAEKAFADGGSRNVMAMRCAGYTWRPAVSDGAMRRDSAERRPNRNARSSIG